jgi:hypothetical protein
MRLRSRIVMNANDNNTESDSGGLACLVVGGLLLASTSVILGAEWQMLLLSFGFSIRGLLKASSAIQRTAGFVLSGLSGSAFIISLVQKF